MPIWLNHDHGDGGVVDLSALDAYSRVEMHTDIFEKSSKLKWTHHLAKLNKNKSCYVNNI
jgi:hypothetical protein